MIQRKQIKSSTWFGDGALTPKQNQLFAKNKALDGKKNPEIVINRIPMQTITGFKRSIKPSFLTNSQSRPLANLHNPFPAPKLGGEMVQPQKPVGSAEPRLGERSGVQQGGRVRRQAKKVGGVAPPEPLEMMVGQKFPTSGRIPYVNSKKMTLKFPAPLAKHRGSRK